MCKYKCGEDYGDTRREKAEHRQQTASSRQYAADSREPTADSRRQRADKTVDSRYKEKTTDKQKMTS
jgi:hypothetical protein